MTVLMSAYDCALETVSDLLLEEFGHTGRVLCLVTGASCSGKSFFVCGLRERLHGFRVEVLCLDDYFRDKDDPLLPLDSSGKPDFDSLDSSDKELFRRNVLDLMGGRRTQVPEYDVRTNTRLSLRKTVDPPDFVLAEGLYPFHFLSNFPALRVFLEAPLVTRLARRIERDSFRYGVPEDVVEEFYLKKVETWYQEIGVHQKKLADIVVKNG